MAGLLDMATPDPSMAMYNGMLTPDMQRMIQQKQLLGLAQGLLQAGAPSRIPVGFGQALGQGINGMQQGQEQGLQQAMQMPGFMMNLAKAKFYQDLAGGQQGATPNPQGQPGQPNAPIPLPSQTGAQPSPTQGQAAPIQPLPPRDAGDIGLTPQQQTAMAIFDPAGSAALTNLKSAQYKSPQGEGQKTYNTESAKKLAANEAELPILQTTLDSYKMALTPDSALGGKSPAETAIGGFSPETRAMYGMQFPNMPFADQQGGAAYNKLENILNPAAAQSAKANFQRVTGQEYKTFQGAQGLNTPPAQRPAIIKQSMQQVQNRINQIQQENARLRGVVGTGQQSTSQASSQPPQGAKQAPDGNYYIPDPQRPGKYLQWVP